MKYILPIFLFLIFNFSIAKKGRCQNDHLLTIEKQLFIDSLITSKLEAYNVPGLTIGLVLDSSKVFYKGYGYSDINAEIPVNGEHTGFKIASITKTFTALALMRLYEEGKIDLHKDIKHFLPNKDYDFLNGNSITIHQLLTHTAGFDMTDINDAAKTRNDLEPLSQTIQNYMPDLVHLPGEVHSYSNFGYALLGYIVEQVSGLTYSEYLRKEIFAPLNMEHSSVEQPLPEHLETTLSKSYYGDSNTLHQRDYSKVTPADGIVSSAKDISNYMLGLLNAGKFNGNDFLGEDAYSLLTKQQFGSLNTRFGICYSFFEGSKAGRRSLEHTGGATGFASLILLLPETGTGLFISQNKRNGAQRLRYEIARSILDSLVPQKIKQVQNLPSPISNFESIANKYIGHYRQANYPHSTFEKITQLLGMNDRAYSVSYNGNNRISINNLTFIPISETHFILDHPENNWEIEFKINQAGEVDKLFNNTTIYNKIEWYQRNIFKRILGGIALIFILVHFITASLSKIRNNKKQDKFDYLYLMSSLIISAIILFGLVFWIYGDQLTDYGIPIPLKASLLFSSIVAICSIYTPIQILKTLRVDKKVWTKLWRVTVACAIAIIIVYFWNYNLLGFYY